MKTYAEKSIGQLDLYNYYKESCIKKNREYVDYNTYSNIIKDANVLIREAILYKGERIQLPYKLGELFVHKYENVFNPENKKAWKVDWKKTKEVGKIVYFESKYGYKWKWDKRKAIVKGKKFYVFKACRQASRGVQDAINNKHLDFFH